VTEEQPLGTIGCVALLDDLAEVDRLLVVNGDILTDMTWPRRMPPRRQERPDDLRQPALD
jgi:NDP-sugar pyrophosphorylase family protein